VDAAAEPAGAMTAPGASNPHPCLRCGACCASYRVAFHWSEAQPDRPDGVPLELTAPLRRHERVMRGTEGVEPMRCVALQGDIGVAAGCGIYPQRPTPCRELRASFEDGRRDEQCDRARQRHGLPPLVPADWVARA
jgi:hypothetical protein